MGLNSRPGPLPGSTGIVAASFGLRPPKARADRRLVEGSPEVGYRPDSMKLLRLVAWQCIAIAAFASLTVAFPNSVGRYYAGH